MDLSAPMNLASVVQAGASVFGFLFVGYQLWQARRNIRGATEHTLYVHYTEICKLLIGKPHLRPCFYENKTMSLQDPNNPNLREEIDMMSEAILGLIEQRSGLRAPCAGLLRELLAGRRARAQRPAPLLRSPARFITLPLRRGESGTKKR
jgi:hypothetical protein